MLVKVLGPNGEAIHGGSGRWPLPNGNQPGEWLQVNGEIIPCRNGLHACTPDNVFEWIVPNARLFVFEGDNAQDFKIEHSKIVYRRARLLSEITETWPLLELY